VRICKSSYARKVFVAVSVRIVQRVLTDEILRLVRRPQIRTCKHPVQFADDLVLLDKEGRMARMEMYDGMQMNMEERAVTVSKSNNPQVQNMADQKRMEYFEYFVA